MINVFEETSTVGMRGLSSTIISVSVPVVATIASLLGFPFILGEQLPWLIGRDTPCFVIPT